MPRYLLAEGRITLLTFSAMFLHVRKPRRQVGIPLGREGPSAQIPSRCIASILGGPLGACAAGAGETTYPGVARNLLIAAAFNTPWRRVLFSLEEIASGDLYRAGHGSGSARVSNFVVCCYLRLGQSSSV